MPSTRSTGTASNERSERIDITNAATGSLLDSETISAFSGGIYLQWKITGSVVINVTRLAGTNAVLSGLFLDSTASSLTVSAPTAVPAGSSFGITVTAKDPSGNVATSYTGTVQFTSSDISAGLPADYTFTAADAGTHTFAVTLKTAGAQTITAADTAMSRIIGTDSGITVQAAAAQSLAVTGFPTTETAGVPNNFTVTAYDAYGNVATGFTGTVSFTSSDTSAGLPADYTFTAGDAGPTPSQRH